MLNSCMQIQPAHSACVCVCVWLKKWKIASEFQLKYSNVNNFRFSCKWTIFDHCNIYSFSSQLKVPKAIKEQLCAVEFLYISQQQKQQQKKGQNWYFLINGKKSFVHQFVSREYLVIGITIKFTGIRNWADICVNRSWIYSEWLPVLTKPDQSILEKLALLSSPNSFHLLISISDELMKGQGVGGERQLNWASREA